MSIYLRFRVGILLLTSFPLISPAGPPSEKPVLPEHCLARVGESQYPLEMLLPGVASPRSGQFFRTKQGHGGGIRQLGFSLDNKVLASAGTDGILLWDIPGKFAADLRDRFNPSRQDSFLFSAGNRHLAISTKEDLDIWSDVNWKLLPTAAKGQSFFFHKGRLSLLALSSDGKVVVAEDGDKACWLLGLDRERNCILPISGRPVAAAFAPNSRAVAVQSTGGFLHYLALGGGEGRPVVEVWKKRIPRSLSGAVAFSRDGLLVACPAAGRAAVFNTANGRQWTGFDRDFGEGDVHSVAFSPDGRFLAIGHANPTPLVRIREVATNRELAKLQGHVGTIGALAFSTDGNLLASGSDDGQICIWDVRFITASAEDTLTLAQAWDQLDELDPRKSHSSMRTLLAAGEKSVPVLRDGLRHATGLAERVKKQIEDLDSPAFRTRAFARASLENEGLRALPMMRTRIAAGPSAEVRETLGQIVAKLEDQYGTLNSGELFGEPLRAYRAVQVLENAGGKDAIAVLRSLTDMKQDARLRDAAKAALARMKNE